MIGGMEYADKGTSLIGHVLNVNNYDEAARLSYCASRNFSLACSEFEEVAEIAKDNPVRVHFVESVYQLPMNERAGAEGMAGSSLRCSEQALAISDEIKYVKEGKYTREERYLKEEISRLIFSILLGSPCRSL